MSGLHGVLQVKKKPWLLGRNLIGLYLWDFICFERFPCLYFSLLLHIAKPTPSVFEQHKTNIQEAYACIDTHAVCIWILHSTLGHTSDFVEYNRLGLIRPMIDVLAHE